MPVYRNQTNTLSQIAMLSRIRITTPQEAVAFLRTINHLNLQVAQVLQRSSLAQQRALNPAPTSIPVQTPDPTPIPTPEKTFVPEDLSTDEGYSEEETEAKVEKLKAAKSKTQKKKEQVEKDKKEA